MTEDCYILTAANENQGYNIFSVTAAGKQSVFVFEDRDDAERYVIMMEQDPDYIIGESAYLDITEVPLSMALDVFNEKKLDYVFIKKDDLFVPPH